jgi:hypothetical protein
MMKPIETIEFGNQRAEIYYDEDMGSPREEYDNFGMMVCSHRNYILGDEQLYINDFDSWDDVEKYLIEERNAKVVLPLSLYDHSGITMNVGVCHGWDSGQVGFIYASEEDCVKEFGKDYDMNKIESILRGEVETYDEYLRGNVYGYKIFEKQRVVDKCPHCDGVINERDEDVETDSCWGFYGLKYICEEVRNLMGDVNVAARG